MKLKILLRRLLKPCQGRELKSDVKCQSSEAIESKYIDQLDWFLNMENIAEDELGRENIPVSKMKYHVASW